jgi:hypothetical protein
METSPSTRSGIEVSREEWATRTITKYGEYSKKIDIIIMALMWSLIGGIVLYMVPTVQNQGQLTFWLSLILLLFIWSFKVLNKITTPLSSYQTVIIRG